MLGLFLEAPLQSIQQLETEIRTASLSDVEISKELLLKKTDGLEKILKTCHADLFKSFDQEIGFDNVTADHVEKSREEQRRVKKSPLFY